MHRLDLTGMRVVVTGGSGFLGRHVCAELAKRDVAEVFVPRSAAYDLTQKEAAEQLMADARPQVVLHLAAEVGGIGANRSNPGRYFYANMAMAMHLIEAARTRDVQKFVQVGTVCSYPKHTPVPFCETALWSGYPESTNAPYGVAKKAALVMLQAYRQQYGLHGVFVLPSNLYGPGDNFDLASSHVIPAMIRKIATAAEAGAAEVELWGSGAVSREFLYVADCAKAIVLATEQYDGEEPVNIGSGRETRIDRLADKIRALVGFDGRIVWNTEMPDGQPRRCLDVRAAQERFGFVAETSLEAGLRETVQWWREQERSNTEERFAG